MKCKVLHKSNGRIRIHIEQKHMTLKQADILEYYLKKIDGVLDVKVYDRTCDIIIKYICKKEIIISSLSNFSYKQNAELVPESTGRELNRKYEDKLVFSLIKRCVSKLFLPVFIHKAFLIIKAIKYIIKGLHSLKSKHLQVEFLDAAAITASILRRDFATAGSVMFLLKIGEILEEWTHKKSVDDLARTMSLNVDKCWLKKDNTEILVSVKDIKVGDNIVVRTGNVIPLDGKVIDGEAGVNQASITGESLPVVKTIGSYVYAGTVIDEGECVICVDKITGNGRYDKIVKMIEESEKLKSSTETKASHLADKLVPYSLGGTILTYLLTKNVTKALSILMVDFSCALKLSMPLAVLSAMRECSYYNMTVKGGKFLESVSQAKTIVFDKTGTLTHACPRVAKIETFNNTKELEMLSIAACLEEHYPHSIANAVVEKAKSLNIIHEEMHSKVEYVVAHGISSEICGEKVIIGSYHFVFEDENAIIKEEDKQKFDNLPNEFSHLYMAISGVLSAVICIQDPLREEAPAVITTLKKLGIEKVVMMTGDSERTACSIAQSVGVDEYYSEVLPEDKANFIKSEHEKGRKVIMIGDGVNDSPALSEADVGIAIADGAAIAREIADITVSADDLFALVTLKSLSDGLMHRINSNYLFIIAFNIALIGCGVSGILPPKTTAFLHNSSTIGISLKSMTKLLQ